MAQWVRVSGAYNLFMIRRGGDIHVRIVSSGRLEHGDHRVDVLGRCLHTGGP